MTRIEQLCNSMLPYISFNTQDNIEALIKRTMIRECPLEGLDSLGNCKMGGKCSECWRTPINDKLTEHDQMMGIFKILANKISELNDELIKKDLEISELKNCFNFGGTDQYDKY